MDELEKKIAMGMIQPKSKVEMEKYRLRKIFRKTDGFCHLCHRKLVFANHGLNGAKGAWHIEHSKPKSLKGCDHLNNLFASCITCNLEKGTLPTRLIRSRNGKTRAPLGRSKKEALKRENIICGAMLGGTIGLSVGGPIGGIIGGFFGAAIGEDNSPKK